MSVLDGIDLIDHHCHGITTSDLDRAGFEALLTEADAPGPGHGTLFDAHAGLAVRRWCAPLLDLDPLATGEDYLDRRARLGAAEVNRRLIGSLPTRRFLVDTGLHPEQLTTPGQLAALAGGTGQEIVRLEQVAEHVAAAGTTAAGFAGAVRAELTRRCATAVGVKTIAAYRVGLDLDPARPTDTQVTEAAGRLLAETGDQAPRVADPVLTRFLIWAGADLGLPIQFHVGYGDADVNLHRCDPLLLTPLIRALAPARVPVMLLHNYPFHRHAGYLAQVFDHVFVDVSLALHNTGPGAPRILAELLELAPFGSVLFSTDAYGLAELYVTATAIFTRALTRYLDAGVADGAWTADDAARFATGIARDNATRAYQLNPA